MSESKPTAPKLIGERIKDLASGLSALQREIAHLAREIEADAANKYWPGDAPSVPAQWNSRDMTPPPGLFWASNGEAMWLLMGDGKPIPSSATAVRYWTTAGLPPPPRSEVIEGEVSPA